MTKYNGPIKEVEVVEKVKLTKEQAEAIEFIKTVGYSIDNMINSHVSGWSATNTAVLNVLKVSEMARALYIGYEIEPEQPKFQPGDRVVREDGGEFLFNQLIVEVIGVSKNQWFEQQIEYEIEGCSYFLGSEYVRHATPEEIYWLEELGRDKVGDFRIGDIFISSLNSVYEIINDIEEEGAEEIGVSRAKRWMSDGHFKGIYPADSFRPFKKEPSNE